MPDEKVTPSHLEQVTTLLTDRMAEGFNGLHARMGRFEDEVRPQLLDNVRKIAILEYQASEVQKAADTATSHMQKSKQSTRNRAAAWGTGAAAFIVTVVKVITALRAGG